MLMWIALVCAVLLIAGVARLTRARRRSALAAADATSMRATLERRVREGRGLTF
jgi:hypothetical protein